jgi:hypothetical protein
VAPSRPLLSQAAEELGLRLGPYLSWQPRDKRKSRHHHFTAKDSLTGSTSPRPDRPPSPPFARPVGPRTHTGKLWARVVLFVGNGRWAAEPGGVRAARLTRCLFFAPSSSRRKCACPSVSDTPRSPAPEVRAPLTGLRRSRRQYRLPDHSYVLPPDGCHRTTRAFRPCTWPPPPGRRFQRPGCGSSANSAEKSYPTPPPRPSMPRSSGAVGGTQTHPLW